MPAPLPALHLLAGRAERSTGAPLALHAAVLLMAAAAPVQAAPAPAFEEPVALVGWLLGHSGHGFNPMDDAAAASVLSPGLRAAVRASLARSRQRGEPPCGANGDFVRGTQEDGVPQNVRLSAQRASPDRRTVSAAYDVDGHHRERRFMVVLLEGSWKVENIFDADGTSLRRSLTCP